MKKASKLKKSAAFTKRGFALITSVVVLGMVGLIALYAASFTITENKISASQSDSANAYYLAESGLSEALNRLNNDSTWKNSFETNPSWNNTYTRNNALYPGSSYTINIVNSGVGRGDVTVTGNYISGKKNAQRVIKMKIFKALGGSSAPAGVAVYSDGSIKTQSANNITIRNGDLHSNGNIQTNASTNLNVYGDIYAVGNANLNAGNVYAEHVYDKQSDPPPAAIEMPSVSFDNAGDANSLKARATKVYTPAQFSSQVLNQSIFTLNGIHYVTGDVNITGAKIITINGALVSDGSITLSGSANININQPSSTTPSGLLAKNNITFTGAANVNMTGLIYANNTFGISGAFNLNINGGLIGRNVDLKGASNLTVNYLPAKITPALGGSQFAPTITVEHWEEEY